MYFELILFQILLFFISLLANTLSAFAGGGAGLIQLPLLLFLGLPFPIALATHKFASVSLGLGASFRHSQEKSLQPFLVIFILAFGLPGVITGASVVMSIPDDYALIFLGVLTLSFGLYSYKQSQLGINELNRNLTVKDLLIGALVLFFLGFLNGAFSSGTGLFVTFWLVRWFGISYTKAVGYTLILVGLFWNGTGALVLGLNGQIQWSWLPMLLLGSVVGGYIGAHFSLLKGNAFVKSMFELISLCVGVSLVIKGIF